ncbi:MAG: bacteriohemerythrin [Thermodesulfovibrionales bacterium]
MAFVVWGDEYKLNIAEIDAQHKKLFEMVNDLHSAIKTGKGRDLLGDILSKLLIYCDTHFITEERYMKNYGYPEYIQHKKQHDDLTRQTKDFHDKFKENNSDITLDLMDFLKNWLHNHILVVDKRFGLYLTARGVK